MAITNALLADKIQGFLNDAGGARFDDTELLASLRMAIGEYNLVTAQACTVQGLDDAVNTTLPAAHETLLVLGAAGYAVLSRRVESTSQYLPEDYGASKDLTPWGDARLKEFRAQLQNIAEQQRLDGLRHTSEPWSKWSDDDSIEYGEGWDQK